MKPREILVKLMNEAYEDQSLDIQKKTEIVTSLAREFSVILEAEKEHKQVCNITI